MHVYLHNLYVTFQIVKMKTNLPLKKKPCYDFKRLGNIFSNPDKVEDIRMPSRSTISSVESNDSAAVPLPPAVVDDKNSSFRQSNNETHSTSARFHTPFAHPRTGSMSNENKPTNVNDPKGTSSKKIKTSVQQSTPRGKCVDWQYCVQCSINEDCGKCSNCLDKSLR